MSNYLFFKQVINVPMNQYIVYDLLYGSIKEITLRNDTRKFSWTIGYISNFNAI